MSRVKNIYLQDYQPSNYVIDTVDLDIDLSAAKTTVKSILKCTRVVDSPDVELVLNGENLRLLEVSLDSEILMEKDYSVTENSLVLSNLPAQFVLETVVEIAPASNLALSGLYMSSGNYCTQCEPEGFRRITYFLDRPDVMSVYTCKITADIDKYPTLLANGNLIDSGKLSCGKHWVKWYDPSKKPSYLFALVAGNFDVVSDSFNTMSARSIQLDVFVEPGKASQARFALEALKKAMLWDEENYQREYDLDRYMIVAVSDFNFGAMENKGLNIFNDKYILAKAETATDTDFLGVETVVGHEYFHNWTGNRITLANWFQLCLKEGLTVFREQNFAEDITSYGVRRVESAKIIESAQFAEDLGPMSHPVRPDHFAEINNFYTVTVYNKGAEVVRMLKTLITAEVFDRGMQLYFNKNDGHAVTIEHFLSVMEEASSSSLQQFKYWYTEAGLVQVKCDIIYNQQNKTCEIKLSQEVLGDQQFNVRVIPVKVGFLSASGEQEVINSLTEEKSGEHLLVLEQKQQSFYFSGVDLEPICSVLRSFSAPVKLVYNLEDKQAFALLKHDCDTYVMWRTLSTIYLNHIKHCLVAKKNIEFSPDIIAVYKNILRSKKLDFAEIVQILSLPSANYVLGQINDSDIVEIAKVLKFLVVDIAQKLNVDFNEIYHDCNNIAPYQYSAQEMAIRSLKNFCLYFLAKSGSDQSVVLCQKQLSVADNMTDMLGAIAAVVSSSFVDVKEKMLKDFYDQWQDESLLMDKWLSYQAASDAEGALGAIIDLCDHKSFSWHNPNKVRALIGVFASGNVVAFHDSSGKGYKFLIESIIKVDKFNSQLAVRLCQPFLQLKRLDEKRQNLILSCLQDMRNSVNLSKDLKEVVDKIINF